MTGDPAGTRPPVIDALVVAGLGLGVHVAFALYAGERVPPAFDGIFYDQIARRIAAGLGYTWLWPDGSVTYAAHYPIGYPALVGGAYALLGAKPLSAMFVHALLAALGVFAVHRLAARLASRRGALLGAFLAALHPGLVGYTPALMAEAVVGALVATGLWLLVSACEARVRPAPLASGVGLGLACLFRPQLLLLAPVLGLWLVSGTGRKPEAAARVRLRASLGTTAVVAAVALFTTAPWTFRNCRRLDGCTWVSANLGWNLLIGTASAARGGFLPLEEVGVPAPCRGVFGEVEKDRCFQDAALARIRSDAIGWVELAPQKLAQVFATESAAASYLALANPERFGGASRLVLGAGDVLFQRMLLGLGLVALVRTRTAEASRRSRLRRGLALSGLCLLLTPWVWLSALALVVSGLLLGRALFAHPPAYFAVACLAALLLTHAVFFGAQRYVLTAAYVLAALAACALPRGAHVGQLGGAGQGF